MQQINLYQQSLRPQREVLSAPMVLGTLAFAVIAMTGWSVWQWWDLQPDRARWASAEQRLAQVEIDARKAREEYIVPKASPALTRKVKRAREQLKTTQQVASRLKAGGYGSPDGLSEKLVGLARQHVDGTWLTKVELLDGGRALGLEGKSLLPELVPAYIDRLSEEKMLSRTVFRSLELSVAPDGLDEVSFAARTRGIDVGSDDG